MKNRGIVLSAADVHYNNRTGVATVIFSDELCHGDIDGGHTYKIICEHREEMLDQYVQFEVITGVEDIIEDLAEARNTSVQVDIKSMAELRKNFDPIKEALEGMPFFERIAFKQNQVRQNEAEKKMRMIDAREVVAIIMMFSLERYNDGKHPIQAYSSKAATLNEYLKDPDLIRKYVNVIPDIFDLYDTIECEFADAYNETGGRYGRKKYSGYKEGKTVGKSKFGLRDLTYKIPDGLVYPTVAAFRTLLTYNSSTDKYEWKNGISPISVWEKHKKEVAGKIMNFAVAIGDNPNAAGKDVNTWDMSYMTLLLASQR